MQTKPALKDNFYARLENCTFENDRLGRKPIAQNLTNMLRVFDTSNGLILALDCAWGGGKTTFVKMWKNMLDGESKMPNFYFSAWEDDHTKEPLIAIFSELHSYLKSTQIDKGKLETLSGIAKNVFTKALPAISKTIVEKILQTAGFDDKSLQQIIATISETTANTLLESYTQQKQAIVQLKNILTEILTSEHIGVSNDTPFIIFIDELDRTRPTYAVEMLEIIKHLFGIPHLVFVISIDKAQLAKSIQAVYGQIDTQNYLRRFFDVEFILPKPTNGFLAHLDRIYNLKTIKMGNIVKTDNFSLRELEHFASQIRLLELFNRDNTFDIKHGVFILFVKMQDENLYKQIPNITDIKSLTHLAEKLMCNGKIPIDNFLFIEYIKLIYSICDYKIHSKDMSVFVNRGSFGIHSAKGTFVEIDHHTNTLKDIPNNTYSYIVHTYYDFLRDKMNGNGSFPYIHYGDIIKAIDFVTQLK